MVNFLLIAICMLAGYAFKQLKMVPDTAHKSVNIFILYLALPAVSFKYLPTISWSPNLLFPALTPILVMLGGWLFVTLYATTQKFDKPTLTALKITAALGNTSFVGFPLIMAYYSEREINIAIICDQVTFILFSTYALILAANSSNEGGISIKTVLLKLLTFPPFIGCVAALTIPHFINITPLLPVIDKLAATVAPLALFSIGLQLNFTGFMQELKPIAAILTYKLILAPALVLGVALLFNLRGLVTQISIFEAAMPVLLSATILTEEYGLNAKLTNIIIGTSIIVGLFTTAVWYLLLQFLN